jgi:hypothetical protein
MIAPHTKIHKGQDLISLLCYLYPHPSCNAEQFHQENLNGTQLPVEQYKAC